MTETAEAIKIQRGLKGVYFDRSPCTFIDGRAGELRYRGYSIHDLAQRSTFEETCYLLLKGELPTRAQLDAFTDELKAVLLAGALAVRGWRAGGLGFDGRTWQAGDARFLLAGIAGVVVVAAAVSLTSFVRHPEISGRATTKEAHYEAVEAGRATGLGRLADLVTTFLRFVNHYPSHLWLWALLGRLDVYLWVWIALNGVYLARGWLGLVLRFGRG